MPASVSERSVCSSQCLATVRSVTMAVRTPGRNAATRAPSDGQHAAADDDVIGAVAERDVDRDIGGMFQWRSHGVTLIPSVVGWAEGAPAHSRARRASIHSSTMRSCGTSREAIVRSAVR